MISVIVPTLGERIEELRRLVDSLENQTNKNFELIVVSQGNYEEIDNILMETAIKYNHIRTEKKGLSRARNIGLKYAKGNIITFSDDDCWYPINSFYDVKMKFENMDSDVLCFNIYDPISKKMYKNYRTSTKSKMSELDIFRVSSIEIFINLNRIKHKDIVFDERFGLGAIFNSGEENILLSDLRKIKYRISYIPQIVVYHRIKVNKSNFNPQNAYTKGAMFKRMHPNIKGIIYANLLLVKNFKNIENKLDTITNINKGFLEFSII